MERALREAVSSSELGEGKVASLQCSSAVCKVAITASDDSLINQSMMALNAGLPKAFSASAVYQLSNGENAMYVAQSSEALNVDPVSEPRP